MEIYYFRELMKIFELLVDDDDVMITSEYFHCPIILLLIIRKQLEIPQIQQGVYSPKIFKKCHKNNSLRFFFTLTDHN